MLTDEQKQERMKGIGGSDISAAIGLNPWKTSLDLYYEKLGEYQQEIANPDAVHFGNVLEDVVAKEYAERTGQKVQRVNQVQVHPEYSFMLANLDRRVVGVKKVLECKTANQFTAYKWGESGTDEVPDAYLAQITWYMGVMDWDLADLAVLIGGQNFRIYNFELDRELLEMLIEGAKEFWQRVLDRNPPDAINKHDIDTYMAIDNGESIVASDEIEKSVHLLKDVRGRIKELEEKKETYETEIKLFMADNSVLLGIDGQPIVTYKKAKDSKRFDSKEFQKTDPELYETFLVDSQGSRKFLVR